MPSECDNCSIPFKDVLDEYVQVITHGFNHTQPLIVSNCMFFCVDCFNRINFFPDQWSDE